MKKLIALSILMFFSLNASVFAQEFNPPDNGAPKTTTGSATR